MSDELPAEPSTGVVVAGIGLDVAKIGAAAIPFVGGSIVEVVEVLQARREHRVTRLRDEIVRQLGDRVSKLEESLTDGPFVDLLDDAIEKAARTRSDEHISLLAGVIANAAVGHDHDQIERDHILLGTIASLQPAHVALLTSLGSIETLSGDLVGEWPVVGHAHNKRALAVRHPNLADILDPLLADLLAGGLIAVPPLDRSTMTTRPFLQEAESTDAWQLAPYGGWVLEHIQRLHSESA
jgi:hypothetical protein